MKILALVTEAHGGRGGIAQYCRDILDVFSANPEVIEVVVLPRRIEEVPTRLPQKIIYRMQAAKGKLHFMAHVLGSILSCTHYQLILCAHINLLPLAWLMRRLRGGKLVLLVYGIDVWEAHKNKWVRRMLPRVDKLISISQVTLDKMQSWNSRIRVPSYILPNAIDISHYRPGPKDPGLVARYGLSDKKILLTLGRLASSERYKGIDEVLDALPELVLRVPNLVYLVAGDGDDIERLKDKAQGLGIRDRVVFTRYLPEAEKIDHYRLADVYVMPSHGEGFGFVFLEAMACGIPVIGSRTDGGREALRDGMLGDLVTPSDVEQLIVAILRAIDKPKSVPAGLAYFAYTEFSRRCNEILFSVEQKAKHQS